jgi:rRNA biogenesis protein RRP5
MPASKKRASDDTVVRPKSKKIKLDEQTKKHKTRTKNVDVEKSAPTTAHPTIEELDFPRGGGTTFTPLEVKNIRAEAHKEVNDELFAVCPRFVHAPYLFD